MGSPVSDPVNLTKFFSLGVLAVGALGYLTNVDFRYLFRSEKFLTINLIFLVSILIMSSVASSLPFIQNLYGIFGRNTGLLTYLFLAFIFLSLLTFSTKKSVEIYLFAFTIAGIANVSYGIWIRFFGDFIPWTNNYGALLGTFGNPDFAGAFLGMLSGVILSYIISSKERKRTVLLSVLLILNFVTILDTKTTQGLLVAAISMTVPIFLTIRNSINRWHLDLWFLGSVIIVGVIATLGMLQKGPLSSILYKRSVSLRGIYWDAALNTGNNHFLTGVGLDGFGNWFRRERSLKASTWFPGPDVVTNVAHNIYLDMYANGGIILLVSFISLNFYSGWRLLKLIKRQTNFNILTAGLASIYIGYQAQALISINQIGLGIWGWSILGAICAFERIDRVSLADESISKQKKPNPNQIPKSIVLVPLGMMIGGLLALPPLTADVKWNSALNHKDLKKLEEALTPSYFTPQNSDRLANAVIILSNSNLDDQAYKYAVHGVKFNPDYFDGWKMLYYARSSSVQDRKNAISNMKRLDPNNKTIDKLKI